MSYFKSKIFFAMVFGLAGVLLTAFCGAKNSTQVDSKLPTTANPIPDSANAFLNVFKITQNDFTPTLRMPENPPCITSGDTLRCTSESGKIATYISWYEPENDTADGDGVKYEYIGHLAKNPIVHVITVNYGHDSPVTIYWASSTGKYASLMCCHSDLAFADSSFTTILNLQEDSLNLNPPRESEFYVYTDTMSKKYKCTNSEKFEVVGNKIRLISSIRPISVPEIVSNKDFRCVEDLKEDYF